MVSERVVFAVKGGKAVLHTIKLGHNNGLEAEVLAGLAKDEPVIVHPGDKIRDGVAVIARPAEKK